MPSHPYNRHTFPNRNSSSAKSGHSTILPEYTDNNSVNSSIRTPSIIALENLRMRGSEHYVIETVPNRIPSMKSMHAFRAPVHASTRRKTTTVYVHVVFLKVGEIETIKEYFEADLFIEAKWREPSLDNSQVNVSFLL